MFGKQLFTKFPAAKNIHNRHVKYVTVLNQLKCNTTKNNHFILKKYFFA